MRGRDGRGVRGRHRGWWSPHVHVGIDASSLADGPITISASATSSFGDASLPVSIGAYEGDGGTDPRLALDARQQLQRQGRPRARHLLRVALGLFGGHHAVDARERPLGEERSPPSRSRLPSPRSRSPKARELPTPPWALSRSLLPRARPGSAMPPATSPRLRRRGLRTAPAGLVAGMLVMQDVNANGRVDACRRPSRRRSPPPPTPLPGRSRTSPRRNARLGLHLGSDRHARHRRGRRRPEHRRRHLPCRPRGERDRHPRRCRQPVLDRLDRSRRPSHADPREPGDAGLELQRQGRPRARHLLRVALGLFGGHHAVDARERATRGERSPPSRSRLPSPRSRSPKARALPTPPWALSRSLLPRAPTGIRDAAGNLSSFAATGPADERHAGPRRGHARHAGRQCERQGRPRAGDLLGDARRLHATPPHGRSRTSPRRERSPRSPPRERPPRSSSPRAPAPRTPPSAPSVSSSP